MIKKNEHIYVKLNISVTLMCRIITILCGVIVPKIFLDAFGSEAYGAAASISQFLAYITLIEGGIGGVARAALYKPLSENDVYGVSLIVKEIRHFFPISDDCFESIYFGINTDPKEKEKIINHARKHLNPNIKLYQMSVDENAFRLKAEEIK